MNVEKNYALFLKYLRTYIKRDGIEEFITWLEQTDAKTAPASTKYHLSCEGGLIQHSLNVFKRLITLIDYEYPKTVGTEEREVPYSKETIALVALLHDISKVNYYTIYYRNVKDETTGQWNKVATYGVREENERLIFATHEENSLYILSKFFKLTHEEELAVRYHMGSIDATDTFSQNRMITAYKRSPLALLLHTADMLAMCVDELDTKYEGISFE